MSFEQQLATGQVGESLLARFFQGFGHSIIPVYEKERRDGEFRGPQLFRAAGELVLPDMLVLGSKPGEVWFAEAKYKTVFSWHGNTGRWVTGVDQRHFKEYLQVEEITGIPVWLYMLHRDSQPWKGDLERGCPPECPTGLFGEQVSVLRDTINHTAPPKRTGQGHGTSGMVYWARDSLSFFAPIEEIQALAQPARFQRPA